MAGPPRDAFGEQIRDAIVQSEPIGVGAALALRRCPPNWTMWCLKAHSDAVGTSIQSIAGPFTGTLTMPSVASALGLASTSADDASGGTGARTRPNIIDDDYYDDAYDDPPDDFWGGRFRPDFPISPSPDGDDPYLEDMLMDDQYYDIVGMINDSLHRLVGHGVGRFDDPHADQYYADDYFR